MSFEHVFCPALDAGKSGFATDLLAVWWVAAVYVYTTRERPSLEGQTPPRGEGCRGQAKPPSCYVLPLYKFFTPPHLSSLMPESDKLR